MPKLNKSTAQMHMTIPGYTDAYEQQIGDWYVSMESTLADLDMAPLFKGSPDDLCQASHVGYVLKGKFGVRHPDGSEEIFEAGDAFVLEPGHIPLQYEGSEFIAFTPAADAKEQAAVMMPNMVKYAQEHGIELPAELMAQMEAAAK